MFASGKDHCHQLISGHTNKNKNGDRIISPPIKLQLPVLINDIKKLSFGNDHGAYLLEDGTLYAFGNDKEYQLGMKKRIVYKEATKVTFEPHYSLFSDVVCGDIYTMYLTIDGTLIYCCNECKKNKFVEYHLDSRPLYLAGGWEAPVAINANGDICIFTSNPYDHPKIVHFDNEKVIDVCRCDAEDYQFIVALTESGNAYGNGFLNNNNYDEFKLIESLKDKKITKVWGYCRHCIALSEDGCAYGCGMNWYGQIGIDVQETSEFVKINFEDGIKIVDCAVGNLHSAFVSEDGKLLTCGSNFFGQLMLDYADDTEVRTPRVIEQNFGKVTNVYAGSFSTIVLIDVPLKHHTLQNRTTDNQNAYQDEIFRLQSQLTEKDRIIEKLQRKIKKYKEEIQQLKNEKNQLYQ